MSLYKNFIYYKESTTNQWKRNELEKLANSHTHTYEVFTISHPRINKKINAV